MTNLFPHVGELILFGTVDDAIRVEVHYETDTFCFGGHGDGAEFIVNGFVLVERLKHDRRFGRVSPNPVPEW